MKLIKTSGLALLLSFLVFACSEKELDQVTVSATDVSNAHEMTEMEEDDCPGFGYWFMKKGDWKSKGYSGSSIMVDGKSYTEMQMMSMYDMATKKRGMSGMTKEQKEFYKRAAMALSMAAGYSCEDMDDDDDDDDDDKGDGQNGGGQNSNNNGGGQNGNNNGGGQNGNNNGGGQNGGGQNGGGNNHNKPKK